MQPGEVPVSEVEADVCLCQSCGGGQQRRGRECLAGGQDSEGCQGEREETVECNEATCPAFSLWSEWSECSKSCGGGVRQRDRHCQVDGEPVCTCQCYGPIEEFESCGGRQCPEWSPWSSWSSCSKTCGEGEQGRSRRCSGEEGECPGEGKETRPCKDRGCPAWSPWSSWSGCSATCGEGSRDRVRSCGPGARYTDTCPGDSQQVEPCSGPTCLGWTPWSSWSSCTVTCGEGSRSRSRECGPLGRDSDSCPGEDSEEERCGQPCSAWSDWSPWSQCSATCGPGRRTRERSCGSGQGQGGRLGLITSQCPGASQDSQECSVQPCSTSTTTPQPSTTGLYTCTPP